MKKSILCIVLILLMIFSAVPTAVFAAKADTADTAASSQLAATGNTMLTEAKIAAGRAPKVGENPNRSFSVHTFDEKYFSASFFWYNMTDEKLMKDTDTFGITKTYALIVSFSPQSGYFFPEDTKEIEIGFYNDINPTVTYSFVQKSTGKLQVFFMFRMSACTSRIITFDPNGGSGGMEPVLVEYGKSYTLPECKFIHPTGDGNFGNFRCWGRGHVGDKITITEDIRLKAIYREEDPPYAENTRIRYLLFSGGKQPADGEKPDYSFAVHKEDKNKYTLDSVEWWNLSGNKKMTASDTFDKSKVYALRLEITSKFSASEDIQYYFEFSYPFDGNRFEFGEDIRPTSHVAYNIPYANTNGYRRVVYAVFKMESTQNVVTFSGGDYGQGEMRPVAVAYGGALTYPECGFTSANKEKRFYAWGNNSRPGDVRKNIYNDFTTVAKWQDKKLIYVNEINVIITDPRIGEAPDYEVQVAAADKEKYSAKFYGKWYDATAVRDMAPGEAFQKNHAYQFQLYCSPLGDYWFSDPNETEVNLLNTSSQNLSTYVETSGDEFERARFITFYYGVPSTYLDRLEATLTVPRADTFPSATARTSTTGVSVDEVKWYSGGTITNPGSLLPSNVAFSDGRTYIAEITFRADVHYAIDRDAKAKFNSSAYQTAPSNVSKYDPLTRTFRYAYEVPLQSNEVMDLTAKFTVPEAGDILPTNAIAGETSYRITDIGWYTAGSVAAPKSQLMPGNKAVAGKTYFAMFRFTPNNTSAIADHPTAKINGIEATMYGGIASDGSASFVIPVTIGAAGPGSYIIGDADGDGGVSILDATAIQRHLAEIPTKAYDEKAADADGEKGVTILDATAIQRWLAGFPGHDNIGKQA